MPGSVIGTNMIIPIISLTLLIASHPFRNQSKGRRPRREGPTAGGAVCDEDGDGRPIATGRCRENAGYFLRYEAGRRRLDSHVGIDGRFHKNSWMRWKNYEQLQK